MARRPLGATAVRASLGRHPSRLHLVVAAADEEGKQDSIISSFSLLKGRMEKLTRHRHGETDTWSTEMSSYRRPLRIPRIGVDPAGILRVLLCAGRNNTSRAGDTHGWCPSLAFGM